MTTPQQRYYQTHRDAILPKMREREKTRRETRKSKYSDDPTLHEEDKAIARRKYYCRVGRVNKGIIEEALARPDLSAATRTVLEQLAEDSSAITTVALRKMISGGNNKTMPRGKKSDDAKKDDAAVVAPAMVEVVKKEDEVKEKKEKKAKVVKAKREIIALPGEHIHIKVDKGVKVTFD
jgi:hypothetical protein